MGVKNSKASSTEIKSHKVNSIVGLCLTKDGKKRVCPLGSSVSSRPGIQPSCATRDLLIYRIETLLLFRAKTQVLRKIFSSLDLLVTSPLNVHQTLLFPFQILDLFFQAPAFLLYVVELFFQKLLFLLQTF